MNLSAKRYIWVYGEGSALHAGTKAVKDIKDILLEDQWIPFSTPYTGKRWRDYYITIMALLRIALMPKGCIFFIQFPPTQLGHSQFVCRFICWKFDAICLIHDLNEMRGIDWGHAKELKNAAVIISHNRRMSEWLQKRLPKHHIIELEIFDYLHSKKIYSTPSTDQAGLGRRVAFAGNLSPDKSAFIYTHIDIQPKIYLLGTNADQQKIASCYEYAGFFQSDTPQFPVDASMGLIWDGTSTETCDGIKGNYLRLNSPHKTSLYLSSGIPVVIWREAAMAEFVIEHNCGVTIDRLADIPEKISNLSEESYSALRNGAERVGDRLRNGYYTRRAVGLALEAIKSRPMRFEKRPGAHGRYYQARS